MSTNTDANALLSHLNLLVAECMDNFVPVTKTNKTLT